MLKYEIIVNESFKTRMKETLDIRNIDRNILEETIDYLFINAQVMDRITEGFHLWLGRQETVEVQPVDFMKALLIMSEKFRKNMERYDGIVYSYLTLLSPETEEISTEMQPWQYEQTPESYKPIGGIYQALLNMGLKTDFIDMYYLDGSLMEIYEDALQNVTSLNNLINTANPSINDIRDGLITVDARFRKLYNKLFTEQFEDAHGVFSCLVLALQETEKSKKNGGALE
jgi:hypothetical protein